MSCESLETRLGAGLLDRILMECLSSGLPLPQPHSQWMLQLSIYYNLPCYKKGKENHLTILRLHLESICHLV